MKESKKIDVSSMVFNALADIAFETGCSKDDIGEAVTEFYRRFYIDAEQDEDDED